MKFLEAKKIFESCKDKAKGKPIANNTRLLFDGKNYIIRLHDTDIITIQPNNHYKLFTGNWYTITTKARLNEYSPARISQRKGQWYIGEFLFQDHMVVDENGTPTKKFQKKQTNKNKKVESKLKSDIKKYIEGFCDHVKNHGLELPSNGDCWACSMRDNQGNTDIMGYDHLIQHFRECYFVPSLLGNAIVEQGYNSPATIFHMIAEGKESSLLKRILRKYFQKRFRQLLKVVSNEVI